MCEANVTFEIIKATSILISFHLMDGEVTGELDGLTLAKREVMKITILVTQ